MLGSSENNDFHFYVETTKKCGWNIQFNFYLLVHSEWPKHRRKQSPAGKEPIFTKVPDYYAEYIDGVKRWVELVFIADSTIVNFLSEKFVKLDFQFKR